MAHVVESVTIIDSTTAQGAWDSPFQGQPLDLVSWAGPNYITFDLACCHQTYMMVLCQSEGIDPPESLVDSIKHREQLRQELATFYKVNVEAIKALVNKTTYGWGCKSWRIQYGVHPFIEHPFIKQFYADMVGICDQLRRPHQYDKNGEPVDHRRHNEPLCVRTHFIQAQIMRCIRNRLHLRWGFDPDFMIELFDALVQAIAAAAAAAEKEKMRKIPAWRPSKVRRRRRPLCRSSRRSSRRARPAAFCCSNGSVPPCPQRYNIREI